MTAASVLRLEFFAGGSPDCPLLLLYGRAPETVAALAGHLGSETFDGVDLDTFLGVEPVGGCRVVAKVTRRDLGIRQIGPTSFAWELSRSGWAQVAGLMEPFAAAPAHDAFQWLWKDSGVSFVISTWRGW
jgi:hypothetical protein